MRWKSDKPPYHKNGETRTVRRYAWVPTELHDGYTVWLEHYWSSEIFEAFDYDPRSNYWRIQDTSIHHPDRPDTGSTQ